MKYSLFALQILLIFNHGFAQEQNPADARRAELDFLIGSWNVEADIRLSSQGPWEKSQAKSMITKTVGSKVIEEQYTGTREGQRFTSKSLFAVNNLTREYQLIFVDSEHGALIDYLGEVQSDSLIFTKLWSYPNGSKVELRLVFRPISSDEFICESMRKPENEETWDVTKRLKYTRTK